MNDNYVVAAMPKDSEEGIIKGMYKFEQEIMFKLNCHGAILPEVIKARIFY